MKKKIKISEIKISEIIKALRRKEIELMIEKKHVRATCLRHATNHLIEYSNMKTIEFDDYIINLNFNHIARKVNLNE